MPWSGGIHRMVLLFPVFLGDFSYFLMKNLKIYCLSHFPGGSGRKVSACSARGPGLTIPSREGNGTPLQYSCLENPIDGGAWWSAVHGIAEGRTQLSDFTFTFHFHALEEEMATHSTVLAWRIPGTGEPGALPSMGSHRVGHD